MFFPRDRCPTAVAHRHPAEVPLLGDLTVTLDNQTTSAPGCQRGDQRRPDTSWAESHGGRCGLHLPTLRTTGQRLRKDAGRFPGQGGLQVPLPGTRGYFTGRYGLFLARPPGTPESQAQLLGGGGGVGWGRAGRE